MAERIEGLAIGLDLDHLALDRGLTGLKDRLKTVNSEMKANLSAFDRADQSVRKYETTLRGLNSRVEVQKRIVQEVRAEYHRMVQEYGEGSKQAEKAAREVNHQVAALNNLERNIQRTTDRLGELRREQRLNESGWTGISKRLEETSNRLTPIGEKMQAVGRTMAISVTAPLAGVGIAAVRTGMEFDQQMSKVQAISGATGDQLGKMRDQAIKLGSSTTKSSSEVAAGMKEMAAAGYSVNEIMAAMPGVIAASEASGADMAQTAETMSAALNIFGLEAGKASDVADILAQTANISAADITDMQYALKYAGPPAAALGVSLEELSGSIGIMTNAGMKGEQAGTTLRAALLGLLDPSEENSKLMNKMGIEITDAQGNFVGLSQLVRNLSESMQGQTETQKAATLASLVGTEAVSGMLSLMKAGPAEIDKMTKSLENSGGASAKAAATMTDNFAGAMEELKGTMESIGITISDELTPYIRDLAEWLTAMGEKFQNLSPEGRKAIIIFGLIAAGIAPVTIALGALITSIGAISGGIGSAVGWLGKLRNSTGDTEEAVRNLGDAEADAVNRIEATNNALNDGAQAVQDYNDAVDPTRGSVDQLGDSERDATRRIEGTTEALNDGERALQNYNESSSSTGQAVEGMGNTARTAANSVDSANQATTRAGRGMTLLRRGAGVAGTAVTALGGNFGTAADLAGRLVPQLGNAEEGFLGVLTSVADSTNGFEDFRQNADGASDSTNNLNNQTGAAATNVNHLNTTTQHAAGNVAALGNTATTAATAAGNLGTGAAASRGRLAGLGASALTAVRNFGSMSRIMGIARVGVAAFGGPVGLLATVGLPALIAGGVKLTKHLKEENIPAMEDFGSKVSDTTTKSILSYKKLNDDATAQLNQLNWSGQKVSKDIATKLTETFADMGNQISSNLKKDYDKSYGTMTLFFQKSKAISSNTEQAILENMRLKNSEKEKLVQDSQKRITQIFNTASKDKRKLTSQEQMEINTIQQKMMNTAVETLSKSAVEQRVIMAKLRTESSSITARQASETIQNSKKAKDGTVKEANDKYNKTIAAIIRERDETGSIGRSMADKLIKEAKRQRDEAVKAAKDMHNRVVDQAVKQAGKHGDEIDRESGKVLSTWDKISQGVHKVISWFGKVFKVEVRDAPPTVGGRPVQRVSGEQYAKGTSASGHPGGPAIVGEKGRELAHIPGRGLTMLGSRGAEYHSNLPKGTSVLPNKHTEKLLKSYGFPGYEGGIGDAFDWIMKGPKALLNYGFKKFNVTDQLLPGWFKSITGNPLSLVKDMALGWVKEKMDGFMSSVPSAGAGVQRWAELASKALMMTGQYTADNLKRMLHQMETESGGNPRAINLWDINATKYGTPSKGLMQVIDPTFRSFAMPGYEKDIWDPLSNMLASIRYAVSRYGTLANAYRGVGYAAGGRITKPQIAAFAENGYPEYAITTEPRYRQRSLGLYNQLGKELGVPDQRTEAMALLAITGKEIQRNNSSKSSSTSAANNIHVEKILEKLSEQVKDTKDIVALLAQLVLKDTTVVIEGGALGGISLDDVDQGLSNRYTSKMRIAGVRP
ncbi:phage tail tape measure protein [Peribacillus sp. SCS-26]|uniref:phage tail tape measure protein n=1 Tax=Paraperibacillus marinus TaxID=3115295 RepID=UPI0039063415